MNNPSPAPSINNFDIIIVGAGMVGSALACGLADAGYQVALVDQRPAPDYEPDAPPHIRVSALSYASELFLRTLGAWDEIEKMRAAEYKRLAVWEKLDNLELKFGQKRLNKTEFNASEVNKSHLGFIVENDITQLALHRAFTQRPGVQFICPFKIRSITLAEDFVRAESEDEVLQAKLIIGADGAQSLVRQSSHIPLSASQYDQHAMVITIRYEGKQQDITWQAFTPTGPVAFLPLPDIDGSHFASLVWYDSPETISQLMKLSSDELVQQINAKYPEELPEILDIVERGRFPLTRQHAKRYVAPRVALAGDSAHTINPLAGQGVNLGFQDAEALIGVLSQSHAQGQDPGLINILKNYEDLRRNHNALMMTAMDVFYHSFSNQIPPLKLLRNLGLHLADRAPFAKKEVLKFAMGLQTQQKIPGADFNWRDLKLPAPPLPKSLPRLPLPTFLQRKK
ncbi:MAG: FAD-dependent oxidoreductase [Pseudomonadales bacterium]|nr:FAD-dependent oxidoreductase [Pseudomonadales bacterium]